MPLESPGWTTVTGSIRRGVSMRIRRRLPWAIAVLTVGAVAATAVGVSTAASKHQKATVRVAVVTDIGGLNDKGFNHLSNVGLQRAIQKLKVRGGVYITNTANDRTPNLRAAA